MADVLALLPVLRRVHQAIYQSVIAASETQGVEGLSAVAHDDHAADTIFAIDRVSEEHLVEMLGLEAEALGGILLLAEGLPEDGVALPKGRASEEVAWRVMVDPIDGTRGLMYQKRSAWVLTGVAPNRGAGTRLSDVQLALQTEIPLIKQHLLDAVWAVRGRGVKAERINRLTGDVEPLKLTPSRVPSIEQGYSTLVRFFPGARDVLAAMDDELVRAVLGAPKPGRALCFEDQYACTGGQIYELCAGHDRFIADLRPLMEATLRARGFESAMYCHPYDICTALIAEELGVCLTDPTGAPLDVPLDLTTPVSWVGYANSEIKRKVEPMLRAVLERHGLLQG